MIGGGKPQESFKLTRARLQADGLRGRLRAASASPKSATPAYQKILLYVDAGTYQVRRVLMLDAQGNRNRFDFVKPEVNVKPPPGEFEFKPPPGNPGHPAVTSPGTYRYGLVSTKLGRFRAVTGPRGLLSVELRPGSLRALERRLEKALGTRIELERDDRLPVLRQIAEYVAGKRRRFDTTLDWSLTGARGFQRRVLGQLAKVRFGHTLSYGELASRAGRPGAARAVGGAMAKNPIPLVVPCHRVLAAGGRIGGFTGGLSLKRALLALESA